MGTDNDDDAPSLLRIGLAAGFASLSARRDGHDNNYDHDDVDDQGSTSTPYRDDGAKDDAVVEDEDEGTGDKCVKKTGGRSLLLLPSDDDRTTQSLIRSAR